MQKGFVHVLILVLVMIIVSAVIIGAEFYLFGSKHIPSSSLKSATSDSLKTISKISAPQADNTVIAASNSATIQESPIYQDVNYGFKFSYPSGYHIIYDSEDEYNKRGLTNFRANFTGFIGYPPPSLLEAIELQKAGDTSRDRFDTAQFTLWIFSNPNNLDPNQWYYKYWYYPFVWGDFASPDREEAAPTNESSISGQPANFQIIGYQPGIPKYVYIPYKNDMFLFRLISTPDTSVDTKVMSSFTFIGN